PLSSSPSLPQPAVLRPSPEGTPVASASPLLQGMARPRGTVVRAAAARWGRVQRAAQAVVTGEHEGRATGGAARKCRLFYLSAKVVWQTKPQFTPAMVQALHQRGILPFKYIVADCLYGNSPDFWAACEACVGTVAFVATPADTRGWLQPLATTTHTSTYKGTQRTKRVAVTDTPPSTVAALAHAIPATFWYRRTVAEGTKGPITYEFARKRITLCKEGQPTTAVWLLIKRTLGAHPQYWYYLSNAPVSAPLRLFVWLSGVR